MGKAEIIAQLPVLSPQDLAEVRSKLDELAAAGAAAAPVGGPSGDASAHAPSRPARVESPRLADPGLARDFRKQVTELAPDAAV